MDPHPAGPRSAGGHTLMDGNVRDAGAGGRPARSLGRFLGRRRNFVVDPSYQIRSAIIAVLGMGFLIVFAAALFHLLSVENAHTLQRRAPGLLGASADVRPVLYLVAVGLFFVAAVFAIEILETHKTAGVVYKVTRGLREIETGRWGARVTLRRHDNFKEMEEAFNAATRALRDQIDHDLKELQGIESQARLVAREFESGNREGALVMLRRISGDLQAMRERKRNLAENAPVGRPGPEEG